MTKVDVASLEAELGTYDLDLFHKRYTALKYLDLPVAGVTSFSQIERDIYVRSAFRNALDRLEEPLTDKADDILAMISSVLMEPLYRDGVPPEAGIPVTFRNQLERVVELLNHARMSAERAKALWGEPRRTMLVRKDRRILVDDSATTVAWMLDYINNEGSFDVSTLRSVTGDIKGMVYPAADELPSSPTEPGKVPFIITYRKKSRVRRDEKAVAKMIKAANKARQAFKESEITRAVPVAYRRMIEGPEQYWSIEQKLSIVRPTAIKDPLALMAFYHGGHVPGENDSMAKAARRIETDETIQLLYEVTRLPEEHNPRLHRIKFWLSSREPLLYPHLEVALVDEMHHIAQYEFGPYSFPEYANKRLKGYFDGMNKFHPFSASQQRTMKFFSYFRL